MRLSFFPARIPKWQLATEQPSTECWIPPNTTHIQEQRRSQSKTVGRVKLNLESNPIPVRDAQRTQTKPCVHQETPQRLSQTWLWVFKCLLWRYRSAVASQNLHRTGETDSWREHTKPCVHQDPEERSRGPTRDWPRLAHECPGVSGGEVGQWCPAAGLRALHAVLPAWELLKEVIFITFTIVWPQVRKQGGNTTLPFKRKLY